MKVCVTVRFKFWTTAITLAVAIAVFLTGGDQLISLYLTGEGDVAREQPYSVW